MNRVFTISFLAAIAAYGLSFLSIRYPSVDAAVSVAVLMAAVALFRKSAAWGVSLVLAELVFGSFGRVFILDVGPISLTVRQLIFIVALGASAVALTNPKGRVIVKQATRWPFIVLAAFVVLGVIRGIALGNAPGNIFGDANGYLPLLLAPVFILAFREERAAERIFYVVFGVSAATSLLTLAVLWIYAHGLAEAVPADAVYKWIRDERLGEITRASGGFYRIFFQSHVWTLIVYFLALGYHESVIKKARAIPALVAVLAAGTLLVSFSRAFWLAQAAGLAAGIVIVVSTKHLRSRSRRALLGAAVLTALGLLLAFGVTRSIGGVIPERIQGIAGEAAAESRWNLLPVMWNAIREHPVLGSGFGKELTYKTLDPRLIAQNGTDEYTTYAFEWGYLDFWLKMGLGGLVAQLVALGWIVVGLWRRMRRECASNDPDAWQTVGVVLALLALAVTHIFSPYLNHPLGVGFLLAALGYAAAPRIKKPLQGGAASAGQNQ